MAHCENPSFANGDFYFLSDNNNSCIALHDIDPFNWKAIDAYSKTKEIPEFISVIELQGLISRSKEVTNELLDFAVSKVPVDGLKTLKLLYWESVQKLEIEVLDYLIAKSAKLSKLEIEGMSEVQECIREDLGYAVVRILQLKPPLSVLRLVETGFRGEVGDQICTVLIRSGIATIRDLELVELPEWFDSDQKCEKWAQVITL